MTDTAPAPSPATDALAQADRLRALLEQEFTALKAQALADFEALQTPKTALLERLSQNVGALRNANDDPAWQPFRDAMAQCRDLHRRNEILISRQLDAIRGTLQALQGNPLRGADEVYDRLGQLRAGRRARGYSMA